MTLQDFINEYNGEKVGDGQCGYLVDEYLEQVLDCNTTYDDAIDYWKNGIPGFSIVTSPEAGDIACYGAHGVYTAGHIAIYAGNGEVFEQNADPDGSAAHLFARANTYLLGYLRKDEVMNATAQQVSDAFSKFNTTPSTQQQSYYQSKTLDVLYSDLINGNCPSEEVVTSLFEKLTGNPPNTDQLAYYPTKVLSVLYQDIAQPPTTESGFTPYSGGQLYVKS